MPKHFDTQRSLSSISRSWPRPGEFIFYMEEDYVWLHKIRLPQNQRNGEGTKRMAQILSITDKASLNVCLVADPIPLDEHLSIISNPNTFHLVRWYMRFGFIPHGPTEDGFVMERPFHKGYSSSDILKTYVINRQND